jgi:hypothetical protein
VAVRTIWIVDDDAREAQFLAAVLEYETEAPAVLVSPRRFLWRVGRGNLPDALILDEETMHVASPEARRSLRLIDRLLIVGAHLDKAASEQDQHPRSARRLRRPLIHRHVVRAMLWLDHYTDDDKWSAPQAVDAEFELTLPLAGRRRLAAAADRNEAAEWEATGQWSTEYE